MVTPLSLCVLRYLFHLRNFRFHSFYQLGELFLAFLSCLGVDILGYAFTVDSRREPPLVEVVVYHGDASRATLAYLPLVGLKFLLWRGFRGGGFTCLGWLGFWHFCVCTAGNDIAFFDDALWTLPTTLLFQSKPVCVIL